MAFYDLTKEERMALVETMTDKILISLQNNSRQGIIAYFSNEDTYIRKNAYLSIGKLFYKYKFLQNQIFSISVLADRL